MNNTARLTVLKELRCYSYLLSRHPIMIVFESVDWDLDKYFVEYTIDNEYLCVGFVQNKDKGKITLLDAGAKHHHQNSVALHGEL